MNAEISRGLVQFFYCCSLAISICTVSETISAGIIQVPQDQPTIQAGIDAAQDGDVVLVSPGTYREQLHIAHKTITLASQFYTTRDRQFIDSTVIDGDGGAAITATSTAGPSTEVIGFTIRNAEDGIRVYGKIQILNNYFIENGDAIDYSSGGGICRHNKFENNSDDAIDLDNASEALIEYNTIVNNNDDGIEIRLHPYQGPLLKIVIRGNIIAGNREDGIQLIDYPALSDRFFLIEHNLIYNNAMVGLGLMNDGVTVEDFRAASIPERIHVFNNTFAGNPYGITGGDNLIALNNLFVGSANIAVKNIDGNSVVAYSQFWKNGKHNFGSHIEPDSVSIADPLFMDIVQNDYRLQSTSPAINAGAVRYLKNAVAVLNLPDCAYAGFSADLGRFESNFVPALPKITSFTPASGAAGTKVTITGTGLACASSVAFNAKTVAVLRISDTEIQAVVPEGATTGAVSVIAPAVSVDSVKDFIVPPSALK